MLDDMFDYLENLRQRPVWQPIPAAAREVFRAPLPQAPVSLAQAHESFMADILPYAIGNAHPGFMGWVHGGGTPVGMLAEMLAAGLNANLGGRDQIPVEVERQIVRWMAEIFDFPDSASGLFVTGTSMANLIAVLVARTGALGGGVRRQGLVDNGTRLTAYASAGAHSCVAQAMDLSGLGSDALRRIPMDDDFRMDMGALAAAIAEDRQAGFTPFFIAATAGTVETGAIDPLSAIADLAQRQGLWFHVDGAFGALARLSPELAPLVEGISRADSIAFDFHKWGQVPYDAGFVLVRDGSRHRDAFASPAAYLRRETRGMAAGSDWPCDLGPDLSRSFRALKTWFTFKVYGTEKLGQVIANTCALARYLAERVLAAPELELMAPVALNIVCFRYRCPPQESDRINGEIAIKLQESGIVAPSTTTLNGHLVLRAAIVNHRTRQEDIDALLQATLAFGRQLSTPTMTPETPNMPPLIGLAALLRQSLAGIDLEPVWQALMARATENPKDANALFDLSTMLQLNRKRDLALAMQRQALEMQQLYHAPTPDGAVGLRVLALMAPGDLMANTPIECLLESGDVSLDMLYIAPWLPLPETVPDHDVLFVAAGEPDSNQHTLDIIDLLIPDWPRPVIHTPERISRLTRDGAEACLWGTPGLVIPRTVRVEREILAAIGDGARAVTEFLSDGDFPIIARPVGSHAGRGLEKLDAPAAVAAYLESQSQPDAQFYISRFVDYRSADGQFRKYRIVLIDGKAFLCHLGISDHWMIHYLNAGMLENAAKRAEESACMASFDEGFARRHDATLQAIYQRMGLDYLGIDCAETPDGQFLVFEVDTGMIVHDMDPPDIFPYKHAYMSKVFAAFRQMLARAAQGE